MTFEELLLKARPDCRPPERLLALDPGETLGFAVFTKGSLSDWGQVSMMDGKTIVWEEFIKLFEKYQPTAVVCEDYRVYQHKLQQHSNSEIVTLRFIGAIDLLWYQTRGKLEEWEPITYQMASMAKGFCKDARLKEWGYWKEGLKHSRDAIRHGCYYLLFNKRREEK